MHGGIEMRKVICALCLFLSFVNNGMSAIDDREYVEWKDYPNIVRVKAQGSDARGFCTGTEIGKYVITAAHCVEGFYHFTIERNNGEFVEVALLSNGNAKNPDTDWAILELPKEVESKYVLSQDITSESGALYGFGGLRILTDEELIKVREYLYSNNAFNADDAVKLLESDIPGIGYIYNDSDRLKMSPCSAIGKTENGVEALCVSSSGNSGGGLFIDNKEVGILSKGSVYVNRGMVNFASIKVANDVMQKLSSGLCDEDFIRSMLEKKYSGFKVVRLNDYYLVELGGLITDSCGNILVEGIEGVTKISSIEHVNGQYKITKPLGSHYTINSRCGEAYVEINKAIATRLTEKRFDALIYLISDNERDINKSLKSVDGGRSFYTTRTEAVARFLFSQQEIDNMPDEWKKCLLVR